MSANPLVSIVIPVYNGENYLREAIDSALAQTYDNCEVVVINDGATDKTEEIALGYGDRIRYFCKENGGVSTALNLGIEKMRGEYFSWLSHDDIYYPDKVAAQIDALRQRGDMTRVVWGDFDVLESDKGVLHKLRFADMYDERLLTDSVFPILTNLIGGCSLLIHKSEFERVGLFREDLRYTQDYYMWFKMFRNRETLYLPQPLYTCRKHNLRGSVTDAAWMRPQESALRLHFTEALSADEATRMFGSPFEFYRQMYVKMSAFKDDTCVQVREIMKSAAKPEAYELKARRVADALKALSGGRRLSLCIFCAGRFGLRLYYDLVTYGISVDYFADNAAAKQGSDIADGIKCLSFEQLLAIKEQTLVAVAAKFPEEPYAQLKRAGFKFVTTKQDLERITAETEGE